VSYIDDLYSLVRHIAEGKFATQPDVNRAMISLRSYLLRLRRDFETDAAVRHILDTYMKIPVGTLSPHLFQQIGVKYEPHVRAFADRVDNAELHTILRKE
jgi:hypothetical protein